MAGVVADSVDPATGAPKKFVIGMQRPSPRSFWKTVYINRGVAPVEAEDPEVAPLIRRCVLEKETLTATFIYDVLGLADVVVVDVQCDYNKEALGNVRNGKADIAALEESLGVIGGRIRPDCLVLIETTVPPGTTEYIAYPIIKKAFEERGLEAEPLLSHSFERVMPGRHYVASIRDFWRVCSGINETARERVKGFLSGILNVKEFPLTVLDRPIESETCKIVENSFRATLLAFLHEWSIFAERNGVDLIKVIEAIKVRPTHSNMIFPGPGIGGYCLPKDGGLGVWAYQTLMGFDDDLFNITPMAIDINDTRGLHAAELVRDALRNMGKIVGGVADRAAGGVVPGGRGGHAVQRVGGDRPEADGDGRGGGGSRSLREALVGAGEAGELPGPGAVDVSVLPEPGEAEPDAGAQGPGRGATACGRGGAGGAAPAVSGAGAGCAGGDDGAADGGDRLFRHPGRREDSAVLRAGVRGEGAGPGAHQAAQGRGPEAAGPPVRRGRLKPIEQEEC